MKFLVNELPYYNEYCYFQEFCCMAKTTKCPRVWDKYKVCSEENPHECELLIELQALEALPKKEEEQK